MTESDDILNQKGLDDQEIEMEKVALMVVHTDSNADKTGVSRQAGIMASMGKKT